MRSFRRVNNVSKKYILGFSIVFFICFFTPVFISLLAGNSNNFNKNMGTLKDFMMENGQITDAKTLNVKKIKVYHSTTKKIEEMDLDQYLYGVVAAEMPVSFNIEALKAQAIAARTFAITRLINKCTISDGGDICDTTHCQVYISRDEKMKQWEANKANEYWNKIVQAVDSTKGQVLSYNGFLVMNPQYFAISSGKTENSKEVFGSDIPYLISVDSPGEDKASKYKSSVSLTYDRFISLINANYKDAEMKKSNIKSQIQILSRTEGGGVNEISVGKVTIKGTDFRKLLSLNSTNFSLSFESGKVIFNCIGYGHGVGLSQWGANAMGNNGHGYIEILSHYYTGVQVKSIEQIKIKRNGI